MSIYPFYGTKFGMLARRDSSCLTLIEQVYICMSDSVFFRLSSLAHMFIWVAWFVSLSVPNEMQLTDCE